MRPPKITYRQSRIFKIFLSVVLASLLCSNGLGDESLRVGFGEHRPPYIISTDNSGIEVDIVRTILNNMGYKVEPVYLSNIQLHTAFDQQRLDLATSVRDQYDFKTLYYSDPYIKYSNVAVSRVSNHLDISTIADLKGKRVGAWELAHGDLGEEFKQVSTELGPRYFEYDNQQQQNLAFWQGKVDVLIVDELIFKWMRLQLGKSIRTDYPIVTHLLLNDSTEYKVSFKDPALRDRFNKELQALGDNGEYQAIIDRYTTSRQSPGS